MKKTLRGRPRLNLGLAQILEAIRRHRHVVAAARELGCSDAYIHVRLKEAGLSLQAVLDADKLAALVPGDCQDSSAQRSQPCPVGCCRSASCSRGAFTQ